MSWFKSKTEFKSQEQTIKTLIESLLGSDNTVIEIDFTNAKFDLYNEEEKTSVAIDSVGVKIDIVKEDEAKLKIIALDSKMADDQLSVLKNLVAQEATKRREERRNRTFISRTNALEDTINSLATKNGRTDNTERD